MQRWHHRFPFTTHEKLGQTAHIFIPFISSCLTAGQTGHNFPLRPPNTFLILFWSPFLDIWTPQMHRPRFDAGITLSSGDAGALCLSFFLGTVLSAGSKSLQDTELCWETPPPQPTLPIGCIIASPRWASHHGQAASSSKASSFCNTRLTPFPSTFTCKTEVNTRGKAATERSPPAAGKAHRGG